MNKFFQALALGLAVTYGAPDTADAKIDHVQQMKDAEEFRRHQMETRQQLLNALQAFRDARNRMFQAMWGPPNFVPPPPPIQKPAHQQKPGVPPMRK